MVIITKEDFEKFNTLFISYESVIDNQDCGTIEKNDNTAMWVVMKINLNV
jgi:hypothetical protein